MTKRLTRARSICGSCSGKSGTLSGDCGDGEPVGGTTDVDVVPGCECSVPRPQNIPAKARPLSMRKRLRVRDVFIIFYTKGILFLMIPTILGVKAGKRRAKASNTNVLPPMRTRDRSDIIARQIRRAADAVGIPFRTRNSASAFCLALSNER